MAPACAFTRRCYDWTDRYPAIAGRHRQAAAGSFTLDGEAVVCGGDGVAVFDALHRRRPAPGFPDRVGHLPGAATLQK
jgi:ATP-dependent DNA ligase